MNSKPITQRSGKKPKLIVDIAVSVSAKRIAIARSNREVELWSESGELIAKHRQHKQKIESVYISPCGSSVISIGKPKRSRQARATPDIFNESWGVPAALDCREVYYWQPSSDALRYFDPFTRLEDVYGVAFVPNSDSVAYDANALCFHDPADQDEKSRLYDREVGRIAASRSGKLIAVGLDGGGIAIWNRETNTEAIKYKSHSSEIDGIAFSEDDQFLGSTSEDGSLCITNLADGSLIRRVDAPCKELFHFGYIDSNRSWAVVSRDHGIQVFGHSTERDYQAEIPTIRDLVAAKLSPDGSKLVTANLNGHANIYETPQFSQVVAC